MICSKHPFFIPLIRPIRLSGQSAPLRFAAKHRRLLPRVVDQPPDFVAEVVAGDDAVDEAFFQ